MTVVDGEPRNAPVQVLNIIGGADVGPLSDNYFLRENPARVESIVAEVPLSGAADVAMAMDAADGAQQPWARRSIRERRDILGLGLRSILAKCDVVADLITRENGKPLVEARAEVDRAVAIAAYPLTLADTFGREALGGDGLGTTATALREPLGTVAVITPWNFPVSVALRKLVPAMLAGNAVVWKPSELTPLSSLDIARELLRAGVPDGVLNVVFGGAEAGQALVEAAGISCISFTGSTGVGLGIARAVADRDVKVQLEMGGKNAMVALDDADPHEIARAAVGASFTAAGQWCVATSRLLIHQKIYEETISHLRDGVAAIVVGPGDADATTMGPVASSAQFELSLIHI